MYRSEKSFSKMLMNLLNDAGFDVTRIESHATGNGIPDMFVQGWSTDCWLELKNDPSLESNLPSVKVAWRPGQQAWYKTYHAAHVRKHCCTFLAAKGGIYIIPNNRLYQDDTVHNPWFVDYKTFMGFNNYQLRRLIVMSTHSITTEQKMLRFFILDWIDRYLGPDADWDPECILDQPIDEYKDSLSLYDLQFELFMNTLEVL